MKKRILCLFLALMLCLTLLPTSAYAEGGDANSSNIGATTEENDQPTDPGSQAGGNGRSGNEAGDDVQSDNEAKGNGQSGDEAGDDGHSGNEAGGGQPPAMGAPGEAGNSSNVGATTEGTEGNDQPTDPESQTGGNGHSGNEAGDEQSNSETDIRTEIWCVSKPDSIGRSYDGTTDGGTIPINLTFTDGTNEIEFEEGTDFTAVKTFDSADAGWHTVTVEITLIGEVAEKYKLKAGEEKFEIGGNINKAYPDLTVALSKTTCTVGEKLLPLLSVDGAPEDAEVTYYYLASELINWAGSSDVEGSEAMPRIDENTAISEPGTYYVYAKTGETKNYKENRSATVELTISEKIDPVVTVLAPEGDTYFDSFPAALNAAQNGNYVRLNKDVTVNAGELGEGFTVENALAVSGKSITLDLNGYVLESNGVPMTVKNGATLIVTGAGAKNTENITQIGLNLDLLVEKGGTLFCTGGRMKKLQLQDAGEGGYNLKLAGGAGHCTLDAFSSENKTVTINDVLKVNHQGLALHAENAGTAVRIEKNTLISQIDPALSSFYVGSCSDHRSGEDGTCVYCGAVVEAGDNCIAHATADDHNYVWHFKTLQELVQEIGRWIDPSYETVTVKFLKDVTVTETLTISQCNTRIILDLDGHTISGNLDVPMVDVNYTYGPSSHCIAIQNGTIENTGTGAALKFSNGATTLEDVAVKGDMIFTLLFFNSSNYTPTFLGGGSFTRICAEGESSGWSVRIEKMLPKGCYFADLNTGARVERTYITSDSPLEKVTVKPCSHKDADGNSTFTYKPAGDNYYYCSVCGNLCPHASRTENKDGTLHCNDCQLTLTAVKSDQKSGVTYYIKLSDAFGGIYESVIWPLCDQPCTQAALTYIKGRTIDLNGCTVTAEDSQGNLFQPYINDYTMTLQNSAEKQGHYVCDSLLVQKGGKLVVPAGNNNLFVSAVVIGENGAAGLAGGSFGSIRIGEHSDKKLTDLLVSGYYFADTTTGKPAALYDKDGKALNGLINVTVKPCSHDTAICGQDDVWKCFCGQKTFVASVMKDDTTTLYTDLQEAFRAADGGTVKLMARVLRTTQVNTDKLFTLDLNGQNVDTLIVNSKITIRDSTTNKGTINSLTVSSNMTVADLLEEGYAFQRRSDNSWPAETGKTVSNVSVRQTPIKSVTLDTLNAKDNTDAPTTMSYGTTGGVKLSASCNMLDTTLPDCQWYEIGSSLIPIDNAKGMNYFLPDDLTVGTHSYRVTFTKDGYSKSAEITITVTPVSLDGAAVTVGKLTYNGTKQSPTVMVKLNNKTTLTSGKDFTVTATEQTDVGSYTLTISGNGSYSGEIENVEWKIEPMKIELVRFNKHLSKSYDGSAVFDLMPEDRDDCVVFCDESMQEISVPVEAYEISNVRFVVKDAENNYVDSPKAGSKSIAFTIKLKSKNYVLQASNVDELASELTYTQSGGKSFTIIKGKAPQTTIRSAVTVINGLAKTYEMVLADKLPELSPPCEYGSVSYSVKGTYLTDGYKDTVRAEIVEENGQYKLKLTVPAVDYDKVSSVGTLDIKVTSDNYQDFRLTIGVKTRNKVVPVPDGTISASDLTYGQTLNDSKITGRMKHPETGDEIKGTFAWKDNTIRPNASRNYQATWTFTPDESYGGIYAAATGTVKAAVNPRSITDAEVTLDAYSFVYDGKVKTPGVAVVLDGAMLEFGSDKDYGIVSNTASKVGTYAFTVIGNHNYTGRVTVQWSITERKVTPTIEIADGSCVYTGEAIEPAVTVRDDLGNTIDPKEYDVSFKDNTDTGTALVTVIDKEGGNYILSTADATFRIKKAAGGSLGETEWSQRYTHTKDFTYTPDWSKLPDGQNWSYSSTYSVSEGSKVKLSRLDISDDGRLTYAISNGNVNDRITITLRASCDNYEDFTITMNITLTAKDDQQALVITGNTSVAYGQTLKLTTTGGSGTGAVTYRIDTAASTGEAAIDENGVLTPVRVGSVSVIAVKAGDSNYNDVISAPFVLMIKPATPPATSGDSGTTTGGSGSSSSQGSSEGSSEGLSGGSSAGTTATPTPAAGGKAQSPTPAPSPAPASKPASTPAPANNNNGNKETKEPFIKGENGKEGWQVIESQTDGAKEGETIHVDMNGAATVPGTIFDSIKGRDITVTFDLGGGILWTVNGLDVTAQKAKDIDFGVTMGEQAGRNIPVDVINHVTGERYSMNLTLAYEGEFGFTATLTVNMDAANAGLYANLFYYNPETGELEFMCAGKIDEAGNTELTFNHASDYTIVIDTEPMNGAVQDGTETGTEQDGTADEPDDTGAAPSGQTADEAADGNSGDAFGNGIFWILIGAVVVVVIAAIGAVYVLCRRKDEPKQSGQK